MLWSQGIFQFTVFTFFLYSIIPIASAAGRAPKAVIEFSQFKAGQLKDLTIQSKIEFNDQGSVEKIRIADLSTADSLDKCPVDTMPADLGAMVNELTSKVGALVSKIKDDQGDHCSALNNRIQATQSQVGAAFQYQLIAGNSFTNASVSQDFINQQTQRAAAINQLVLTTSDILQNCISKDTLSDQQVIQKLIAQVVTLSGLFMGGWQGIAIATGGQVIGALPLFTGDLDNALRQFKYFNEMNERGTFLCYLRQIRKTSCLLFANEDDQYINGLDLSFKTGPVRTTIESIERYKASDPQAVEDLEMLYRVNSESDAFMAVFSQIEPPKTHHRLASRSPSLKSSLDALEIFCRQAQPLNPLKDSRLGTPIAQSHMQALFNVCAPGNDLSSLSYLQVSKLYWDFYSVTSFYRNLVNTGSTEVSKIGQTLESMRYFEKLKKSFSQYSNSNAGNQMRINFLDMSRKLSRSLGVSTFRKLFKEDYQKFIRSSSLLDDLNCNKVNVTPTEHDDVRSRALRAMIDLCMTVDPTLTCQDVGNPKKDSIFKTWMKHCVSPTSLLCKHSLARGERELFLKDEKYRTYFDSLCGPQEKTIDAITPPQGPNQLEHSPAMIHSR